MAIPVDTSKLIAYITSDSNVLPVMKFREKASDPEVQERDKTTNELIWVFKPEFVTDESVEHVSVKWVSDTKPEIDARTEYKIEGTLYATPWIQEVPGRRPKQNVSYKLYGTLVKATDKAAAHVKLPSFPKD